MKKIIISLLTLTMILGLSSLQNCNATGTTNAALEASKRKMEAAEPQRQKIIKEKQQEQERLSTNLVSDLVNVFWPVSVDKWEEYTRENAGSHRQFWIEENDPKECLGKFAIRIKKLIQEEFDILAIIEFKDVRTKNGTKCSGLIILNDRTSWPPPKK